MSTHQVISCIRKNLLYFVMWVILVCMVSFFLNVQIQSHTYISDFIIIKSDACNREFHGL